MSIQFGDRSWQNVQWKCSIIKLYFRVNFHNYPYESICIVCSLSNFYHIKLLKNLFFFSRLFHSNVIGKFGNVNFSTPMRRLTVSVPGKTFQPSIFWLPDVILISIFFRRDRRYSLYDFLLWADYSCWQVQNKKKRWFFLMITSDGYLIIFL